MAREHAPRPEEPQQRDGDGTGWPRAGDPEDTGLPSPADDLPASGGRRGDTAVPPGRTAAAPHAPLPATPRPCPAAPCPWEPCPPEGPAHGVLGACRPHAAPAPKLLYQNSPPPPAAEKVCGPQRAAVRERRGQTSRGGQSLLSRPAAARCRPDPGAGPRSADVHEGRQPRGRGRPGQRGAPRPCEVPNSSGCRCRLPERSGVTDHLFLRGQLHDRHLPAEVPPAAQALRPGVFGLLQRGRSGSGRRRAGSHTTSPPRALRATWHRTRPTKPSGKGSTHRGSFRAF